MAKEPVVKNEPLVATTVEPAAPSPADGHETIRITAKKEGFRRAGLVHPTTPTEYPVTRFTDAEIDLLVAEPLLVVEFI